MSETKTHPHVYNEEELLYQQWFTTVRKCREQHSNFDELPGVWHKLQEQFHDDWLCALEILEILQQENLHNQTRLEITQYLTNKSVEQPELSKLISDGFYLIEHPVKELATP